ncbi:MAG: hypothetical protein ABW036_04250 [Flavitalea sp.]
MTAIIDGKKFRVVPVMKPSLAGKITGNSGEAYQHPLSAGYITAGTRSKLLKTVPLTLVLTMT